MAMPNSTVQREMERRTKISLSMKGKKNRLGTKQTEEWKMAQSKLKKGKRPTNFYEMQKLAWERNRGKPTWNKGTKGVVKPNKGSFKKGMFREKSPRWKGGKTPLITLVRASSYYAQWRSDIFKRDNWTCQTCGKRGAVQAHHIKEFARIFHEYGINRIEQAIDCNELWDLTNGVTLCIDCHNLTKNRRYYGVK